MTVDVLGSILVYGKIDKLEAVKNLVSMEFKTS